MVILEVYVDDIILTGADSNEIFELKPFLDEQFNIKDSGCLNYFVRIEVLYSIYRVLLHQKKFIHDLHIKFHYDEVSDV